MANPDIQKRLSPEIEMNVPPEGLRRETEGAALEQVPVSEAENQAEHRATAPATPETPEVATKPAEEEFVSDSRILAEIGAGHVENIEGDPNVILDNFLRNIPDEDGK